MYHHRRCFIGRIVKDFIILILAHDVLWTFAVSDGTFSLIKMLEFCLNFTEVYTLGSNWQWVSIDSDNGLAPNRRQPIIWTNDGFLYWRKEVSLDFGGLISSQENIPISFYISLHMFNMHCVDMVKYHIQNTFDINTLKWNINTKMEYRTYLLNISTDTCSFY